MKSELLGTGSYGCVFYPSYSCKGKPNYKKKLVSKLTKHNFVSDTEYSTSQIVKKIPNYKEHFIVVDSECPIVKKNLKESEMFNQCEIIKEDKKFEKNKYVILYSKYSESLILEDYLEQNNKLNILIRTFLSIIKKIDLLIEKNIIHNDLHFNNMLYDLNKGNILFIDFGLSIQKDKFLNGNNLNMDYLKQAFFRYMPTWNWFSIEFHLLCYMIHYGDIDDNFINDTIEQYLAKHKTIQNISSEFYQLYRDISYEYFTNKLSGLTYEKKIKFLLSFWNTWDNYKIGLYFIRLYHKKNLNINEFMMVLLLLINPNPENRPTSLELRRYNLILINNIPTQYLSKKIV